MQYLHRDCADRFAMYVIRATHANANRKNWCPSATDSQTKDVLALFESQSAPLERAASNVRPAYPD